MRTDSPLPGPLDDGDRPRDAEGGPPPLRLLVVDDSDDDVLLVHHVLRRAGHVTTQTRVDTPAAIRAALAESHWDAVVCDYTMPACTVQEALQAVAASGLDLPFIVVSGNVDERIAVEVMRAGAHDFVGKGNLARLAPALERALGDARERRERRAADVAVQAGAQRIRLLGRALEESVNAILITDARDPGMPLVYVNPAFGRMTGYSDEEVLGRHPEFLNGDGPDQPALDKLHTALRETREAKALLRNLRKDGTPFWNELHVSAVRDEAGAVTHYVYASQDVSERIQYEANLERHANYDALTGLPNRNLLRDRIEQSLLVARRTKQMAGVVYVDLDHLKRINDSLGHALGDEVIIASGARIADTLRTGDTVARIGGDEFVIVLPNLKRAEDAGSVARKVRDSIANPLALHGAEFVLSASIGIALYPKDGEDGPTLLKNADTALYRAKGEGRDCIRFYAPEMNDRVVRHLTLEQDLRQAMRNNELALHYQAITDLGSGRTVGAEALLRWRRADGTMVPPGEFIPIAEDTGLIVPIGRWVFENAVQQALEWSRPGGPRWYVSVNLSARQFRDPGLLSMISGTLERTGVDASLIRLELTESTVMQDPEGSATVLQALKRHGIHLSVDDFGTGYSSLAYLKRFPLDTLKIDRSFVMGLPSNRDDMAICNAVIDLAHSLGMEVVAEGVETAEQASFLESGGCESAQGYYFGRPGEGGSIGAGRPRTDAAPADARASATGKRRTAPRGRKATRRRA